MDGPVLASVGLDPTSPDARDGLVSVRNPPAGLRVDEAALVRSVQAFEAVDYVFFRRFDDGRSSQAAAFVIDNSSERLTEGQLAKTHHELWLLGAAPLVYIAWPTRVDVLSCARGPDFWDNGVRRYYPAVQLDVASRIDTTLAARRRFWARRLADGTFWEEAANQPLANHNQAAHESLIQAVVETDQALDGELNPVLRRLLLLTVLVKYLEDRGVFPGDGWFGRFRRGARSFLDVLQGEEPDEVIKMLETLERKFNGDVFYLPEGTRLTKKALHSIAQLIEAKTLGEQRFLWDLYSFDHLPVDVISHLYQRFVSGSTAVYTPPFLASFLLDLAMPYDKLTGRERVLDAACGSGVFLVGAFRRLVNLWRAKHQWRRPDVDSLKSILRDQIFGVELRRDAVDLTAFSLALAVCDALQPNVIWSELRFDPLRNNNLWQGDFFEACEPSHTASSCLNRKFDLVVGNPPFESRFTDAAKRINAGRIAERSAIPDKQIAYLFLDQCLEMLSEKGRLCLIQPSSFLYNLQSHTFRSFVALTGRLESVLDFTSVRGLYQGADPKTIAILVGADTSSRFTHLTFRRTFRTAQRIGFELDHYDRHHLSVNEVVKESKAARANLLGGGRLATVAARMREMRTLGQFVSERGWLMGEGFIEGRSGTRQRGEHLTGQPFLPTQLLTNDGFTVDDLRQVTSTSFYRPGRPELFQPPLVLIREHESLPIAYWDNGPLTYKHEIVGIHAPATARKELQRLFRDLTEKIALLRFAVMLNSPRALVGKATAILKSDIELLPYPESESDLDLTFWEQALADDTQRYMAPYVRLGQKSELLETAADANVLKEYASLYCRLLGSLYDNLRPSEAVFLNGLTCQPFFFGDKPSVEWLGPDCENQLTTLVFEQTLSTLRTVRIVRFYHENVIFIVKPDRLRYWIRSTAIRDADDTLTELRQQGY
jgi:hypothetical protein